MTETMPARVRPEDPDFALERYDVGQAAVYLGVPTGRVYDEAITGRLGHLRVGRLYRFSQSDLDAWREQHRRAARHEARQPLRAVNASSDIRPLPLPRKRRF